MSFFVLFFGKIFPYHCLSENTPWFLHGGPYWGLRTMFCCVALLFASQAKGYKEVLREALLHWATFLSVPFCFTKKTHKPVSERGWFEEPMVHGKWWTFRISLQLPIFLGFHFGCWLLLEVKVCHCDGLAIGSSVCWRPFLCCAVPWFFAVVVVVVVVVLLLCPWYSQSWSRHQNTYM